jgi:glycosyltransferase involved in cell wall biosynthesis
MIKVLMVVCNNVLNGTERYVVDLASHLSKEIFDVHIATPIKGPLSEIIAANNLKEIIYDNNKTIYYSFKGLRNLYKIIKSNKYDIVHANAKFQPCLIAKIAGVKLVVETKHGIFYSKEQLINIPFWRKQYEKAKQYFVNKIIAINKNDKMTLMKYFKIHERKINVIYNGLNFEEIKKKIQRNNDRKNISGHQNIVIGNIGRLTFQKAQEVLLEAFKKIVSKHKNTMLVIIGIGENEKKLKEYVKVNNLHDNVIFKGYISDIFEEMRKLSMLVLTSRFEGTPYVIFESMALGIPVITTDVGGINNILTDGHDSLITDCDSPESTAVAIEKLITDTKLRENIINNAMQTVQKFTVQRMAAETAAFYIENFPK